MVRAITAHTARTAFLAVILLLSPVVSATNFDVSHLAAELNRVSSALATELRNTRGYNSVRFSANQLSREAADLVQVISRNRSLSSQRRAFQEVARRYRELEEAFLRVSRDHDRYVYNQVGVISNLFSSLNSEFYYTNYVEPAPQRYYYVPPVVIRQQPLGGVGSRGYGRGGSISAGGNRQEPARKNRFDYPPTSVGIPNNFSHRSSVLERQQRNNAQLGRDGGFAVPRYRGQ